MYGALILSSFESRSRPNNEFMVESSRGGESVPREGILPSSGLCNKNQDFYTIKNEM